MGKPHPIELRERVVAFVEEGHSRRAVGRLRLEGACCPPLSSFPRKRESIPHCHAAGTIGSYLDPSATPSEAFAWLPPPMDSRFRGNDGEGWAAMSPISRVQNVNRNRP